MWGAGALDLGSWVVGRFGASGVGALDDSGLFSDGAHDMAAASGEGRSCWCALKPEVSGLFRMMPMPSLLLLVRAGAASGR